ncbi:DUF1553 domain-containing protein [Tautonia rosea]|uniref:DUF1553 domain-containing protein n=1 Tax=Tautonia rosea TaxID=2728037 RepID=UPI001475CD9A|nr:DUF1553 domain-containing protein [Tautonia rosea]
MRKPLRFGRHVLLPLMIGGIALGIVGFNAALGDDPNTLLAGVARKPLDLVRVELCEEGIPETREWPSGHPDPSEQYEVPAFGIFRLPHRYVETGIRADRANPLLIRATAVVTLPAGRHRILLRARGASRLSIDGKVLLTTPFPPPITDGHSPIPHDFLNLSPDFRFAPPGNRENWTTIETVGGAHRVLLESIIGGRRGSNPLRLEPGETVVAWSPEGSQSFQVLSPDPELAIPYTDESWATFVEAEEARLTLLDAEHRAMAFRNHAHEWNARRDHARRWLESTPEPTIPDCPPGYPASNPIDHFLAVTHLASSALASNTGTIDFPTEVQPILAARCFSCHQGQTVRGGLRLDTEAGALAGGDSTFPAVVPSDPDESELILRISSADDLDRMPPTGPPLGETEIDLLRTWIHEGASWASRSAPKPFTPPADDLAFLRRLTLDTVGLIPTEDEISRFLDDPPSTRRSLAIDRLLDDPRWADHWVAYWQDVLAENPNILNPTLNNTGPFRWWIVEAMRDNRPVDQFVTELIRMGGSLRDGGPAGFGMASENDVPMAEKGIILGSAFLGINMTCARCHDAPAHEWTQEQLFSLAAMLAEEPITVPRTSSVPNDALHALGRPPLIEVTLEPGAEVTPAWPFPRLIAADMSPSWLPSDARPRDRLAALITTPENERFAQVIVNRIWARLMGRGLVDPVDDWEKAEVSHPELLDYLARELVRGGYDLKHPIRLILQSHAYQRAADPDLLQPDPTFASASRRRLSAEQIVDSLFLATGKPLKTEEINLDVDGGRPIVSSISLGVPKRAWQFASTSNERDRPSLTLPRVQAVVDLLQAFGWRPTRQSPLTVRDSSPNVLQPAILANGTAGVWLTRLSDDHGITALALEDQPVTTLVDRLFLRVFTRLPSTEEREEFVSYLTPNYDTRVVQPRPTPSRASVRTPTPPRYVSWSNHLTEEADTIQRQREAEARSGDPPSNRLDPDWRRRLEDVLWSLINAPEFLFMP